MTRGKTATKKTTAMMQSAPQSPALAGRFALPETITAAGKQAAKKFIEFFTAEIENDNTRYAYARATVRFFEWCEGRGLELAAIAPVHVAGYIRKLKGQVSVPTVKQHLAAIRMLFNFLVRNQVVPFNPASAVRGPKHVVKKGKTPVLTADQARKLLDSIDTSTIVGLRDRAIIGVMVYSFARVSALCGMNVEDYYQSGKRWWFRLHEKRGKRHQVPVHHTAEEYVDAYIEVAGIGDDKKQPLFRTTDFSRRSLAADRLSRNKVLKMIKRRARAAGLSDTISCHTFRATGITAYLENGGVVEHAQQIAAHESPRTTKLYDRRSDQISLDEIERISI